MNLQNVESGHRLRHKLMLGMIHVMRRRRAPDVLRTVFYRPEFFGRAFGQALQAAMRGPSEWTVGERELFAAFTSRMNECMF